MPASPLRPRTTQPSILERVNHFAVFYSYDPADPAIAETRPKHREFLRELKDAGQLVGSGPFDDATGGALIVVRLAEPAGVAEVETLMNHDPFWVSELLTGRQIRPWNPVLNVFSGAE